MISPEQAIEAITSRFGRHPGYRALHAKGSFYRATFRPTVDAARLTRAAHMQGPAIDATVRFSNGSGDPAQSDNTPDVRGMAVGFHLPDGSRTDIVSQTVPRFPVSTPEAFIELIKASPTGFARLWRFPLFLARHPRVVPTLSVNANALRPPPSYAGISYYAVHAFKWIDTNGGERFVRYRWEPEQPEPRLAALEARQRGPHYLQQELRERLARGPVKFTLMVQLAANSDPVDDPAAGWPEDRETVIAGTLEVTEPRPLDEETKLVVFDPMRLTDGIEASNDPVLRFRPRAYSVSVERRASGG